MSQRTRLAFVPFVLLACLCAGAAQAQSLEDRLRDQLRSTLDQLHQLQDQQATLEAAKAAAEQERDSLKAQLAAAKAVAARPAVVRAPDNTPALEAEIAQYKDAFSKSAAAAQQAQADHDKLQASLTDAQKLLGVCEEKNAALLKTGNEILDAYQKFDFGDAIGANEPFVGIKRVELENTAQGFADGLYSGKFDPKAAHAAPAATDTSKANGK